MTQMKRHAIEFLGRMLDSALENGEVPQPSAFGVTGKDDPESDPIYEAALAVLLEARRTLHSFDIDEALREGWKLSGPGGILMLTHTDSKRFKDCQAVWVHVFRMAQQGSANHIAALVELRMRSPVEFGAMSRYFAAHSVHADLAAAVDDLT